MAEPDPHEDTPDPDGVVFRMPPCWSRAVRGERNAARQLLEPEGIARCVVDGDGRATANSDDGRTIRLRRTATGLEPNERALRASVAALGDPRLLSQEGHLRWIGALDADRPARIRSSWKEVLSFAVEDVSTGGPGLRRPQRGALHAMLGYWTTGAQQPATVVMPTGTGKTETMVALLVASQIERLLVVVPSEALRDQIAGKFETLGVLQRAGIVAISASRPVVGRIEHGFKDAAVAAQWVEACSVVVTTPAALNASNADARAAVVGASTHLFVDEAHHVAAPTWRQIRDLFVGKPVVQFTATPYREDGQRIGGRMVYEFPLREAQRDGYFSEIDYTAVLDFGEPDRAIAERAVHRLRHDLEAGFDHLLMARVSRIGRARAVREIYQGLAGDLNPVVVHSTLAARDRARALEQVASRESRIIVCVNMLGEGFDLPSLKIAAVHDAHRSLGVTLQFIGRFARTAGETIARASVFLARPEAGYDPALRKLYSEDADWNLVIRDLSEGAIGSERDLDEFESAFGALPDDIPIRTLEPKMSTVVYRTRCSDWAIDAVPEFVGPDRLVTDPIAVNAEHHVAWFVVQNRDALRWADLDALEQVSYDLFVVYWDRQRQLLYVNSSDTNSLHPDLAQAIAVDTATIVNGEAVYRTMARIDRLVPTNIGVLDVRNRSRRFSMHVGADVIEGFTDAESQTKAKTNIFAFGFEDGERVGVGASLKGRIWSNRVAPTLKHWVDWCDHVGRKVADESISIDEVMRGFIRPKTLDGRPELIALAIELWEPLLSTSEELRIQHGSDNEAIVDLDLRVVEHSRTGPIVFDASTDTFTSRYELDLSDGSLRYRAVGPELQVVSRRSGPNPFSSYLEKSEPLLLFEQDAVVVAPGILLQPDRDLVPFDAQRLEALAWEGVDIRRESQGANRDPATVQAFVAAQLVGEAGWEVVIDDDGAGEIADLVLMRRDDDRLIICLAHCKYSSQPDAGARVADLYELCGQAQKSARWRHHNSLLFRHLLRRERNRAQRHSRSGLMVGTGETIYRLEEVAPLLRPELQVVIAQPGLSKAGASASILELLASTELYLRETASAALRVLCNE